MTLAIGWLHDGGETVGTWLHDAGDWQALKGFLAGDATVLDVPATGGFATPVDDERK